MSVALGVLAAAASLVQVPALPASGLAISDARGIAFVDLNGRRLGMIEGFRFAPGDVAPGLPRFVDRRGRLWRLDRARRRLLPASAGEPLYGGATLSYARAQSTWFIRASSGRVLMRVRTPRQTLAVSERRDVVTSAGRALDLRAQKVFEVPRACDVAASTRPNWILLCRDPHYLSHTPRTIEELVLGRRSLVARPPGRQPAPNTQPVGHWVSVQLSPNRRAVLAQWSAECETPVAYLVTKWKRAVRRFGGPADVSIALGWTPAGAPLIFFPQGFCGATYRRGSGVYVFTGGEARRIVGTTSKQSVAMWR